MFQSQADDDDDIEYPCADGKPFGGTDIHRDVMIDLIQTLAYYFAPRDKVYVSGDILVYYQKGSLKRVCPDVLVTLGIPKGSRDIYAVWREGKVPDFVIEVTRKKTRSEDQKKKLLYARLGVAELLMFDPTADYLKPRFQAFRLSGQRYVRAAANGARGYVSPSLGLTFRLRNDQLRIFETGTEQLLLTDAELAEPGGPILEATDRRRDLANRRIYTENRRFVEESRRREAAERKLGEVIRDLEVATQKLEAGPRRAEAERRLQECRAFLSTVGK